MSFTKTLYEDENLRVRYTTSGIVSLWREYKKKYKTTEDKWIFSPNSKYFLTEENLEELLNELKG